MRKKAKDSVPVEEQYEDFNEDNFTELDELTDQDESEDQENAIDNLAASDLESEYHGADPDLPSEEMSVANKKSLVTLLKENWLYIGIGFVVLVVAVYLIMGVLSPSGSPAPQPAQQQAQDGFNNVAPANTTAAAASANAAQPGATNAASADDSTALASAPATASLSDAQIQTLTKDIGTIVQQNSQDIEKAITSAQAGQSAQALTAIQTNLNNLSTNLDKLNQTLNDVAAKLAVTQSQLYTLLAQQTATDQNLTLRAVVPGRAWLVDKNGNTISVTVGSTLGTFGTITDIDNTDNTVTTSSGYVFQ